MKANLSLLSPQLEAFLAVAKNISMHGAGKEIFLSQTAITQRIKSLEKRLCTTLFIRTHHGVQLTPDGEALMRYCLATQELEGKTLASIRHSGIEFTARISITGPSCTMASRVIPQCLPLLKKYPKLLISFDINDSPQRIKSLQNGTHQFAIIEPQYALKEMQQKKLQDERYILACTSQWKKRDLQDILQSERIIDFDEPDQTTFNYLKKHKLFHLAQTERHYVNRTDLLVKMITEGHGYGVLTKAVGQTYINNKQVIDLNVGKEYHNQIVLAWYERPEPPSYFSELIRTIK